MALVNGWYQYKGIDMPTPSGIVKHISKVDSNGYPVIAYLAGEYPYDLSLARYNGSSWEIEFLSSSIDSNSLTMEIDSSNNITIYVLNTVTSKLKGFHYDGLSWISADISSGYPSYQKHASGGSYMVYRDGGNNSYLSVCHFNGSSFTNLTPTNTNYTPYGIALNSSGYPSIVSGTTTDVYLTMYNGTDWSTILVSAARITKAIILHDELDRPVIAYSVFSSNLLRVGFYNGSTVDITSPAGSTAAYGMDMKITSSGKFIVYYSMSSKLYASVYNGTSWDNSLALSTSTPVGQISAVDSSGNLFIAFRESSLLKISKYDGSSWSTDLASSDVITVSDIDISESGDVIVLYRNPSAQSFIAVYNGSSWSLIDLDISSTQFSYIFGSAPILSIIDSSLDNSIKLLNYQAWDDLNAPTNPVIEVAVDALSVSISGSTDIEDGQNRPVSYMYAIGSEAYSEGEAVSLSMFGGAGTYSLKAKALDVSLKSSDVVIQDITAAIDGSVTPGYSDEVQYNSFGDSAQLYDMYDTVYVVHNGSLVVLEYFGYAITVIDSTTYRIDGANGDPFMVINVNDSSHITGIYQSYDDGLRLFGSSSTAVTVPSAPSVNVGTGTYNDMQTITVTVDPISDSTYYTLDGTIPDNTKTLLSGNTVQVDGDDGSVVTLKMVSYDGIESGSVSSYVYTFDKTPTVAINFGQLVKLAATADTKEWTTNPAKTVITSPNTYSFVKVGDVLSFKNSLNEEATRTVVSVTFGSTIVELDSPLDAGFESNDFEVYGEPIEDAIKFLESIDMKGNKIINLAHGETIQDAVTVQQLNTAIFGVVSNFTSALEYKGDFDASVGNYTALEPASQGDYYIVSVTGTIGAITYNAGDHIVVNKDVVGSVVVGDVDLIKNTEFAGAVYLDAAQTLINKTIDADLNIITNITLDNLKAGVLNTELITLEALDTEIPSAKAVQDLVASDVTELEAKISNLTFTYSAVGDDTTSEFLINHNLGSAYPIVRVINSTTKEIVFADVELTDANNVTVRFEPTPAIGEDYIVIVWGTNF